MKNETAKNVTAPNRDNKINDFQKSVVERGRKNELKQKAKIKIKDKQDGETTAALFDV